MLIISDLNEDVSQNGDGTCAFCIVLDGLSTPHLAQFDSAQTPHNSDSLVDFDRNCHSHIQNKFVKQHRSSFTCSANASVMQESAWTIHVPLSAILLLRSTASPQSFTREPALDFGTSQHILHHGHHSRLSLLRTPPRTLAATFRGSLPHDTWNQLLLSPSCTRKPAAVQAEATNRDDCGLSAQYANRCNLM